MQKHRRAASTGSAPVFCLSAEHGPEQPVLLGEVDHIAHGQGTARGVNGPAGPRLAEGAVQLNAGHPSAWRARAVSQASSTLLTPTIRVDPFRISARSLRQS